MDQGSAWKNSLTQLTDSFPKFYRELKNPQFRFSIPSFLRSRLFYMQQFIWNLI